ncbi:hypothetical protein JTE90_000865 [Oedothorax gibbosus]|uniref:Uncharacterized protein n=1 Tax=Oedothorax gibbosus TaxID=931172 RepID=A0AAV6VVL0_9ARAC|nr:hypothetical protein JTE90_000865 [Oedothorax gibbosus]
MLGLLGKFFKPPPRTLWKDDAITFPPRSFDEASATAYLLASKKGKDDQDRLLLGMGTFNTSSKKNKHAFAEFEDIVTVWHYNGRRFS